MTVFFFSKQSLHCPLFGIYVARHLVFSFSYLVWQCLCVILPLPIHGSGISELDLILCPFFSSDGGLLLSYHSKVRSTVAKAVVDRSAYTLECETTAVDQVAPIDLRAHVLRWRLKGCDPDLLRLRLPSHGIATASSTVSLLPCLTSRRSQ